MGESGSNQLVVVETQTVFFRLIVIETNGIAFIGHFDLAVRTGAGRVVGHRGNGSVVANRREEEMEVAILECVFVTDDGELDISNRTIDRDRVFVTVGNQRDVNLVSANLLTGMSGDRIVLRRLNH